MRLLSPYTRRISRAPAKVSSFRAYFSLINLKSHRRITVGILCFAIFLSIGIVAPASQALAATKTSTLSPGDQASSLAYYKALHACMSQGWYKESGYLVKQGYMKQEDALSYNWFSGRAGLSATNGVNIGAFNDPRGTSGDGAQNCGDSEGSAWITKAATLWGYSSGPQLLCDLGFTRDTSIPCASTTDGASNNFTAPSDAPAKLDTLWKNILGSQSTEIDSITKLGGAYALYLENFQSQCRPVSGGNTYSIQTFTPGSSTPTTSSFGAADSGRDSNYKVTIYDSKQMSCGDLAKAISDPNSAVVIGYQAYLQANKGVDPSTGGGTAGCTAGATTDADGKTCSTPSTSSCAVEGIGWLVCPVISFTATIADSAFSFLSDSFLSVNVKTVSTGEPTYQAWSIMRNLANVAFVIAFLIIVFSQLTGQGIANYGIKKMLPRLVIAAILVNVSFLICQLAVDVSNILGYSLDQVFKSIGAGIQLPNGIVSTDQTTSWVGISATVLAGAAAGGIAWSLGLSVLIPFLLGAVIAFIMVFLILILRQMLIILLIVIAPLAFVAFLLPNTEQWFTRWRKMFTALLLVFPIIGLLFGAASLASKVLTSSTSADGGFGGIIGQIIAAGIVALPLFLLPSLLKGAINSAGNIGAKINGFSDKASKGARNKTANSGVMKSLEHQKQTKRAQVGAGIYKGKNPLSKARSAVNSRLNQSKAYNAVTGNYGTIRGANIDKLEAEETKLAEAAVQLRARNNGPSIEAQFEEAIISGDVVKAKAAQNLLMRSGGSGVTSVRNVLKKQGNALNSKNEEMASALASNIVENHGQAAKQKGSDVLKWATAGGETHIGNVGANPDTWKGLSARELADQSDAAFRLAINSGGVSADTIASLNSPRIREGLSDEKIAALGGHIIGGTAASVGTTAAAAPFVAGSAPPQAASAVQTDPTVISVDHTGDATTSATPATQSARDSQEQARASTVAQARQEQAQSQAPNRGSSTNEAGQQTPDGASEDYHDRMSN